MEGGLADHVHRLALLDRLAFDELPVEEGWVLSIDKKTGSVCRDLQWNELIIRARDPQQN